MPAATTTAPKPAAPAAAAPTRPQPLGQHCSAVYRREGVEAVRTLLDGAGRAAVPEGDDLAAAARVAEIEACRAALAESDPAAALEAVPPLEDPVHVAAAAKSVFNRAGHDATRRDLHGPEKAPVFERVLGWTVRLRHRGRKDDGLRSVLSVEEAAVVRSWRAERRAALDATAERLASAFEAALGVELAAAVEEAGGVDRLASSWAAAWLAGGPSPLPYAEIPTDPRIEELRGRIRALRDVHDGLAEPPEGAMGRDVGAELDRLRDELRDRLARRDAVLMDACRRALSEILATRRPRPLLGAIERRPDAFPAGLLDRLLAVPGRAAGIAIKALLDD